MPKPAQKKPVRRAAARCVTTVAARTQRRIARERTRPAAERPAGRVLVPIASAAKRLGLSVWTLRSWVYKGKINFHRVGFAGRIMISDVEIERLIRATDVAATAA